MARRKSTNEFSIDELVEEMLEERSSPVPAKKGAAKNQTLLSAIEAVVEATHDSAFGEKALKAVDSELAYIADKLELTKMQAVMMSVFMDQCNDHRINLSDLSRHFGCRNIRMLRMSAEIRALAEKKYIKVARNDGEETYRVPREVISAIKDDKKPEPRSLSGLSLEGMFGVFGDMFSEAERHEITTEALHHSIKEVLDANPSSTLSQGLMKAGLSSVDLVVFVHMAYLFVENNDNAINMSDLEDILDSRNLKSRVKRGLESGEIQLLQQKLIEYNEHNGFGDRYSYRLSENTKREMLGELYVPALPEDLTRGLTLYDKLTEKKMYYNPSEQSKVQQLSSLLEPDNFRSVTERLAAKGMRKGFACLFYGSPGTGKTETVYQIAKATGRNIMQLNIASLKSCWVGESEKNVRAIFDRYHKLVENSEVAPILLFNEADAIIGKRSEQTDRAVDKMENTIQNILLEEIEKLDGILIATTNLATNMDKAFERRFIYKIEFGRPNTEAKAAIWRTMLPGVDDKTIASLAKNYDLSGGQIENIARKHTVEGILNGFDTVDDEKLHLFCREEAKGYFTERSKVGF